MSAMTPGPWVWWADYASEGEEPGDFKPGLIDPRTFKPRGYWGNPELVHQGDTPDQPVWVISAGGGEYMPFNNPADAVAIALVPEMIDTLARLSDSIVGDKWDHWRMKDTVLRAREILRKVKP